MQISDDGIKKQKEDALQDTVTKKEEKYVVQVAFMEDASYSFEDRIVLMLQRKLQNLCLEHIDFKGC